MSSPFILPAPVPAASSWQLVDYRPDVTLRSDPAAGGVCTVTFDLIPAGYMWSIQRAVCSTTSGSATALRMYDSAVDPARLLSGTDAGNYNEAEYPLGLLLGAGRQLVGQWTGAGLASIGTLRLQVAVLEQVAS